MEVLTKTKIDKNIFSVEYKTGSHFKQLYGISTGALRQWATTGRIDFLRTPGGKRLYNVAGVAELLGDCATDRVDKGAKLSYVYARVSSAKQRPDLERQIEDLAKAYPGHTVAKDVASGVNFKRPGLRALLERAIKGLVTEVVVMHRDRLARLGFDLLEFVFNKAGARVVVHSRDEGAETEHDLADDLLAVTTLFVASHNGRRAAKNKKRRREEGGSEGSKEDKNGIRKRGKGNEGEEGV